MIKSIFYPMNALVIALCGLSTAIASERERMLNIVFTLITLLLGQTSIKYVTELITTLTPNEHNLAIQNNSKVSPVTMSVIGGVNE